ncbi:LAGLIDADG family homing endonuclease [Streptomyces sp. NPDC058534]|uniref:LAGLIDADG family homing endonuclease n=1 Tax=Streptomyces sp. NPDC058534 TaxID=3346541 RepID=UPI003646E8DE
MDLTVPEYAYMFGFLQADGHLAQGVGQKGRLTAEISVRDIDLLREFQKLTPYYSSITERTRSTNFAEASHTAVWTLCSLEARTRLNGLGLPYGRKSQAISPPYGEFSQRDYLRGVIDADGSVGYTSKGFPFISLTTASTAIATYLGHHAREVTGAERILKRNARDSVYNVFYMMETAQNLAAHFYYPGCLSLERKRAVAGSIATWVRPADMRAAHTRRRWNECEDRILLKLNSPTAAAEALGRTPQSCNLRMWRLRSGQVPMPSEQ